MSFMVRLASRPPSQEGESARASLPERASVDPEASFWQHPSGRGYVFRRGDSYHLAKTFIKEAFPNGLVNLLGIWWAPDVATGVWHQLGPTELAGRAYPFCADQWWAGSEGKLSRISVNAGLINDVLHAVTTSIGQVDRQPFEGIPLIDGKFDPLTGKLSPFQLGDFVTWTLPYTYGQVMDSAGAEGQAGERQWLDFLAEGSKQEDINLLQEFFGYCLSGSTEHQKSLWIYGPPGCGKSVIFKVLIAIVGEKRVAVRQAENFRSTFNGDLSGKRLVYFPDYRHDPAHAKAALNFLLTVAGDDPIQIEQKYKAAVLEKLMAKIVWSSNDMPSFPDSTGATLRRIMMLHRQGRTGGTENVDLAEQLIANAASILRWAAEGAKRLTERGRFDGGMLDPKLMQYAARTMNATYAFLQDACVVGAGVEDVKTPKQDVFDAWRRYAAATGHHQRYNRETFAASLMQSVLQCKAVVKGVGEDFVGIAIKTAYRS